MEFKEFKNLFQKNFEQTTKNSTHLFEVELDKDEMWNLYLDSFAPGTNEVYRERRDHDCSCCRHFIKTMGGVVAIHNNQVKTIWDFDTNNSRYQPVIDALNTYIKSKIIAGIHLSKVKKMGTDKNFEDDDGKIIEWHHFFLDLPDKFVNNTGRTLGDIRGSYEATKNVFKRSLDEITRDSIETILELIAQNSLYKGEEWKGVLTQFLKLKKSYDKLQTQEQEENYAWEQSVKAGMAIGRIRNHSIGTLLINVSEDMDLDVAVKKYEVIVAPSNYKRPKAIFTKKMLEEAKKTVEELGYLKSLNRRYAKLDNITVNNILFSNRDASRRISGEDVFEEMIVDVSINPKKFSKIEEVSIEDFVSGVLPTAQEIEVFFENKHSPNLVSLIAPENGDSPTMFKWNNAFSWAYSGNITDSSMKKRVKSAGGNVEGILRFSIQWNDAGDHDKNDLDAHCIEPGGNEIFFRNLRNLSTSGRLDVDIQRPKPNTVAVENITWINKDQMESGVYKFFVLQFANRGGREGFRAEIEYDGQIFSFDYGEELRQNERVQVAEVTLNEEGFTIKEKLPSNVSSREAWGLKTNQFIPVSVVMFSPNYWDEQSGIGNRHYLFMLKDCVNTENPNGFYNEFLKEDLLRHKRVFEALGGRMAVKDVNDQLSGVGFSSTRRNELVVKVKGQSERVIKVRF